jgi:protease I
MGKLDGMRAIVLVADGFQDEEVSEPTAFLRAEGMDILHAGVKPGTARGQHGRHEVEVETAAVAADPDEFDLLLIPGGSAPERLRVDDGVLQFVRAWFEAGRATAAICHGPQVLISAGVLAGRTVTCFAGIRDDVRLAGARYRDKTVVVDGRLVTSRVPDDLPRFNEALLGVLAGEELESETQVADPTASA